MPRYGKISSITPKCGTLQADSSKRANVLFGRCAPLLWCELRQKYCYPEGQSAKNKEAIRAPASFGIHFCLSVLQPSRMSAPNVLSPKRRTIPTSGAFILVTFLLVAMAPAASAQGNYEIQVYGSETVPAGDLMAELHSNFTGDGQRRVIDGVLPTQDAVHETLELTQGITPWFEVGAYLFTSIRSGQGWEWVGDHLRPRIRVPEDWHWPVGLSLSLEGGYTPINYAGDTWTLEIRPIIDKQIGHWYFAFNPALEKSFHGNTSGQGFIFSPAFKVSYDVTKLVSVGLEYYSSLGPPEHFFKWPNQEQYLFPTVDLNFSPDWEFNFGVGFGLTRSSDNLIVKMIIGRRFHHL